MTNELQLKDIAEEDIDDNDILLGRGGKTNHHPGNASYLKLIEARQVEYMFLESRTEKTEYAMNFVQQLRKEGIRFLKKDDKDGKKWSDVGDTKMREKVSQNLREHQPKLKKQLAQQQKMKEMQMMPQQMPQQMGMAMPNLNQQPSNYSINSQSSHSQQQMPALNGACSPLQQQRQFVDPQALLQQQQFYQMQAMAQQNQMQSQQQFQQLMQQQQMGNNGQLSRYVTDPMMQQQIMSNPMMASNSTMNEMNNNNMNSMNPMPYNNNNDNQWNNSDERERNLLEGVNAAEHRLSNNSPLPEPVESQNNYGNGDMPLHNIERPSIAKRIATLTDMDVAVAMQGDMGESTHSILDTLNVSPVPEEIDGNEFGGDDDDFINDPLSSPKPTYNTIASANEQVTPVLSNKPKIAGFKNDPATVTPNANSPRQQKKQSTCVLDNDMLAAWASTADDEDAFAQAIGGGEDIAGGAPFRRTQTNPKTASPNQSGGAGFRRMVTAPAPAPDPFRSLSPQPPRKANSVGVPTSPKPSALTMSKRGTSNVNDTPETRGHLTFQEAPLGDDFTSSFSADPSNSYSQSSSSNWSGSVKKVMKASLGRDKSAQSRLLKQQCMPYAYGPGTSSFSSTSTAGTSVTKNASVSASFNGWPANVNLDNDPTNSPTPSRNNNGTSDVTPKTQRVLQDFGKMTLTQAAERGLSPKPGLARTAQKFEDTISDKAEKAEKMPMDLMVNKPAPLQWRNRTTTIEALDLDSLEDDAVLKEERGDEKAEATESGSRRPSRSSFSSIAGMWANMPTSEEFENLVSDIAGQQVTDLGLDQQSVGKQTKAPANLALPNLKA